MVPVLQTPRLCLRPFVLGDAERVQVLAGDGRVADTTLSLPHPYPLSAAVQWIEGQPEQAAKGAGYAWAVCGRDSGELMGNLSMTVDSKHARGVLGYWLGVDYWNRGFMTEAVQAALGWGFETLGLHRIEAACYARNPGSFRVMEKCGMRREGLLRGYYRKKDRFEDLFWYGVLRTDETRR